jgi:hypothetical protein
MIDLLLWPHIRRVRPSCYQARATAFSIRRYDILKIRRPDHAHIQCTGVSRLGRVRAGQRGAAERYPTYDHGPADAYPLALDRTHVHVGLSTGIYASVHFTVSGNVYSIGRADAHQGDMTTGGPYFSQFLLTVLCAHAARFHHGQIADILLSRVRLLLGAEIHRPSSIPTVQALLQLSAREMAHGSISQAWLYSGMAFRMVSDLGLHHSSGKILSLGQLTPEDMETRRRLFWSCYFWDK